MKKTEQAMKKYHHAVSRLLPCSRKRKRTILSQLDTNLRSYIAEHPDAGYAQIEAQFGAPEVVAAAYVESAGTAEILKALHVRRRILLWVGGVLILLLLLWSCMMLITIIDAHLSFNGASSVEISEIEGDIPPEDPFWQE